MRCPYGYIVQDPWCEVHSAVHRSVQPLGLVPAIDRKGGKSGDTTPAGNAAAEAVQWTEAIKTMKSRLQMEYDTGIDDAGLIPKHIFHDAALAVYSIWENAEPSAEWSNDLRSEFYAGLNEGKPDFAAALAYNAMTYAHTPDQRFELLNLQGIAMTAMIEAGAPQELQCFRISAFEKALQALPEDRGWVHSDLLCRIRLANANLEYGIIKQAAELLEAARDEYAALLPAVREGRWGYAMHAKAAELAALLAKSVDTIAQLRTEPDPWPEEMIGMQVDPDPMPHWMLALELAFDQKLRTIDTLGYWDAAMDLLEAWFDELRCKPDAKPACAAVQEALMALNMPADNPDYGWVQYYIGVFAMRVGLQTEDMRSEAKDDDDQYQLAIAASSYRKALVDFEANGGTNRSLAGTTFQLAYAIHSQGEACRDTVALDEAIDLYEQSLARLAKAYDQEDMLLKAQTLVNLSEAMAQKAEILGDATLALRAHNIALDAAMEFTLWAHDEGIEVAQANCARIITIVDAIERS
jgi:tetratricopeptide (TPR) repeat protein